MRRYHHETNYCNDNIINRIVSYYLNRLMEHKEFENEIEDLKTRNKRIKEKINKRSSLQKQKLPSSLLDIEIKKDIESISFKINNLLMTESQEKRNVTLNETNRRLGMINHWTKLIATMKKEFEEEMYKYLIVKNAHSLKESRDIQAENIEDNEDNHLIQITREKLNKQDDMLDELHDLLTITKKTNEEMNNVLDNHKPMLEDLDKNMDKVNSKMKTANKKIEQYDAKSSNCFLLTMIWIQFVLMFIFIFGL